MAGATAPSQGVPDVHLAAAFSATLPEFPENQFPSILVLIDYS